MFSQSRYVAIQPTPPRHKTGGAICPEEEAEKVSKIPRLTPSRCDYQHRRQPNRKESDRGGLRDSGDDTKAVEIGHF